MDFNLADLVNLFEGEDPTLTYYRSGKGGAVLASQFNKSAVKRATWDVGDLFAPVSNGCFLKSACDMDLLS